ncbi:MAG: DUF975 family protein [Lachnospiraceae bacterium]|nr:DUF975 family protein [Lachnospiraceae bacterium]
MEPINRPLLKEHAKQALKRNFWMAMLVCFVGILLGGNWTGLSNGSTFSGFGSFSPSGSFQDNFGNDFDFSSDYGYTSPSTNAAKEMLDAIEDIIQETDSGQNFSYDYDDSLSDSDNIMAFYHKVLDHYHLTEESLAQGFLIGIGIFLFLFVVIWLISTAIRFALGSFIGAPIGVGLRKYFMKNRLGKASFDDLFSAFSGGHYMDTVKTLFATNIRIWGWSLLFYFPGLVKYYEYFFVPYIMAENPTISKERARELSSQMSNGHKWQMFVLELSFLGWMMLFVAEETFLALISCGLLAIPGILLMYPLIAYIRATYAELYEERREYMLMCGVARQEELTGF